ncbi:MAG: hypothetical protein AB7I27_10350 [Bacteriovoracaceae bacterium]
MLQSLTTKSIASQALEGVAGKDAVSADNLLVNVEGALESTDFANELAANLMMPETDVKAIQVSPDQALEKPSSLINGLPQTGQPETIQPKVFDPEITNGVESLIRPKTVDLPVNLSNEKIVNLATTNTEVPVQVEPLVKLPQVNQTGRSPAIDFAKSEIDPQLMNMEDFVAQKNIVSKKTLPTNTYGSAKVQNQSLALENNLKSTQVINDLKSAEAPTSSPMNSQQFILNNMIEQNSNQKLNDVQAPQKVFDMSHVKSTNSDQILNQISDYIVQAKAAKEPTVSMRVKHDELGTIDITVQKALGQNRDAVAINIGTHSVEGKNFFQQNSKDLFSHLGQSGINVADFKVENSSSSSKNFDLGQQSQGQQSGTEKHFGSEQNQRRHDSNRRQDLWDLLKDKEAA